MTLNSLEPDFKEIMQKIISAVSISTGLTWIATSCRRTMREQTVLWQQGRGDTAGPIVTQARAGESPHNYGLAADCAPLKRGTSEIWWDAPASVWKMYGKACADNGMTWGGTFKSIKDMPHCEHPRWREERMAWKEGKIHIA